MTVKRIAAAVWRGLNPIQNWAAFALMLAVTFLVFIQVILRYLLRYPLMGIEELLLFPTIWLYFLGGAIASRERNHIECRVVTMYLKKQSALHLANVVKAAISLIVCLWLTYWAYEYLTYAVRVWKQSDMLYIPLVLGESALFIGLALMSLYTLVEVLDYASDFLHEVRGTRKGGV